MSTKILCEHCGSDRVEEAWRRQFNHRTNGWEGYHAYWHCRECGKCGYVVKDGERIVNKGFGTCRV